jgi:hypothetical protein
MYCVLWLFLPLSYKFGCILEIVLRKFYYDFQIKKKCSIQIHNFLHKQNNSHYSIHHTDLNALL